MPCVLCFARVAALGPGPAAARPWWTGELMTRLVRPETGTLVPVLGMVALAVVTGWLLRRASARQAEGGVSGGRPAEEKGSNDG